MSADLYHIELERSESISNLPQGKYIEPSGATAYRQLNNRICDHKCSACKEKRTESVKTFSVLFLSVGTISIESKTVLKSTFPLRQPFAILIIDRYWTFRGGDAGKRGPQLWRGG